MATGVPTLGVRAEVGADRELSRRPGGGGDDQGTADLAVAAALGDDQAAFAALRDVENLHGVEHGDLGDGAAAWVLPFSGGRLEMGDGRWEMVMLEWPEGEVEIL